MLIGMVKLIILNYIGDLFNHAERLNERAPIKINRMMR